MADNDAIEFSTDSNTIESANFCTDASTFVHTNICANNSANKRLHKNSNSEPHPSSDHSKSLKSSNVEAITGSWEPHLSANILSAGRSPNHYIGKQNQAHSRESDIQSYAEGILLVGGSGHVLRVERCGLLQ